jgi:PPOX class probable F420-dependent enzyme
MTRSSAAPEPGQLEVTGYFASLRRGTYLMLTTFKPNGTPVSAPIHGMLDGDRAYFRAWNRSGTAKRLRRTAAVQVTPCTALGLCSYGAPIGATARLLSAEEAGRVAGKLARKYPRRHRLLIPLLRRTRRWQMLHYELLA